MGKAILAYLHEHPSAMDTLEGIAEWWVVRQRIRRDLALLQTVLDRLVKEDILEEISTSASSLYRLRAQRDKTATP